MIGLKQKFIVGVTWSAGDRLVSQLAFFAVTLYLARLIGPEAFGLIGMLTIFMLLAESVVNNGFSQALVQRSHSLTEADSSTIFYVNLAWGVLIYLVLYLLAPMIAAFYKQPELVEIARLLFVIIIINSLSVVARAHLLIKVDFKSQTIVGLIATLISSSVAIYLALNDYGYWSFVWLLLIKALVQNACLWFFCRWYPKLTFSGDSFRSLFKFGSSLMFAGLVATLVNNLYVALIGRYFNATNVGYFTQATNLTNFLSTFISSTLHGVTYPILTSIKDQQDRLVYIYKELIAITALASLPALVGFAAVADSFVSLFLGDEWVPTVPVIQVLCFARAITPISVINMSILNVVGRSDLFLKVDLLKLPITLTTLFISIPFGIQAVAWALFVNVFLSFFINAYYPRKIFGFGAWDQLKIAKNYIFCSGIMYMSVRMVSFESPIMDLLVGVIVGALVYSSLLFLLRDPMLKKITFEAVAKLSKPSSKGA